MTSPAKHLVRRAFDRAAATYDSAAEVQRHACRQLAANLPQQGACRIACDAGCGTGFGLRLLAERLPQARLVALDLAPAMLLRANAPWAVAGDLEHLPLADACLDLLWSSLTAQWCNLDRTIPEMARVLKPGGHLALATLGPRTFAELGQAFTAGDRHVHTLTFAPAIEISQRLSKNGFSAISVGAELHITHHPDLQRLLRSVKAIGANQLGSDRRRGLMTRAAFSRVEAAYEQLRQPQGLPLGYDLIFIHATR